MLAVTSHRSESSLVTAALQQPTSLPELPSAELDLALRLMRRARLLGRLAVHLERAGVLNDLPRVAVDQLHGAEVMATAQARATHWELDRLAHALADLPGLPLVALKGSGYLLAGTPNAAGRLFSDVDLLVPEVDLPQVESRLRDRGWLCQELSPYDDQYYRRWAHELPPLSHGERGLEVDLHHGILMRTARLKPDAGLLLAAAREVPGSRFRVLAPADMVLHAMVHLFYGGEMDDALRELVDIDDLLRHFGATEPGFWEGFWPRAEALDLARPAFYGLRYASRLLETPVPAAVLRASQVGEPAGPAPWLMDRLVPRALLPLHPDQTGREARVARLALYLRSHWVKMPAGMLVRHLSRKLRARHSTH